MKKNEIVAKKITKILYKVQAVFMVVVGSMLITNNSVAHNKLNGADPNLFNKSVLNMPLTLPTDGNPIQVIVDNRFDDEQKQYIKQAIEELDVDLTGIKYEVLLDGEATKEQCININRAVSNGSDTLAHTETRHHSYDYQIMYPINIDVQINKIKRHECADLHGVEAHVKKVIKHEMLHTLGLADLENWSQETETIMFAYSTPNGLLDLSERDINVINTVYTTKGGSEFQASTTMPKNLKVVKSVIKDTEFSM